jgi:uncharacterized protein (TIGR02186 family)
MLTLALPSLVFAGMMIAEPQDTTAAVADTAVVELSVEPHELEADMFYRGGTVRVTAKVPQGYQVALVCAGNDEQLELKQQGKRLGLLWMSVGEVAFNHVPGLYLLHTSAELEDLAPPHVLEDLGVGFAALRERATGDDGSPPDEELFGELVKLKESEGLFRYAVGSVHTEPLTADTMLATTEFRLPPKAAHGVYQIVAYGFREGDGELLGTGSLRLTRSGAVTFISSLAREHGMLYGLLAVLIAIGAGLLTGFVFGLRMKKGH